MPVSVKVTDPSAYINSVSICVETEDVIVLHVDLTTAGKRCQPIGYGNHEVYLGHDDPSGLTTTPATQLASVGIQGLPEGWTIQCSGARYTLWITAIRIATLENARLVYERDGE